MSTHKINIRLGLLIIMFSFCLFLPRLNADSAISPPDPGIEISMDFQDANLKDILKIFSIQSGLNFIASEAVQDRRLTLYFDRVPLQKAMDKLFKANNLSYDLDKDSNIFIVKDWGKTTIETITRVFFLKYATVSSSSLKQEMSNNLTVSESSFETGDSSSGSSASRPGTGGKWSVESNAGITKAVAKLLSDSGSVIEDFRTNSLVVTDTPSRIEVIAKVIEKLDLPTPQIMLEVEMLDVSRNVVDQIGLKYGQTPFTAVVTGATASLGFPFRSWDKSFLTESNRGSVALNSGSNTYQVQLDLLRTHTDTKFLARPRIITLNNETAEVRIATNESIGVTTTVSSTEGTGTTTEEAERTETGVILRVTPQVNMETGEITMFVYPKVAEAIQGNALTSGSQTFQFRDPEERSTKSLVRLRDGDTVVIGGLIRNELSQSITKVPILGDLPLLGSLFRHKNKTKDKERELLVFITPHIIKERGTEIEVAQAQNTIPLPVREQDTASGIERALTINSSLNRFERKVR